MQLCQFESNSAGWHIAEKVDKRQKELGGRCSISTKYTTANKETKIITNAPMVKERCLFKDPSLYKRNSEYGRFMENLMTYSMYGKVKHDDGPDSMAMLVLFADTREMPAVVPFRRPW